MSDIVARLRERLGGIGTPMMKGDNISIVLAGYFDNPDQVEEENGWSRDAIAGCDEVLDAVHQHYKPLIETQAAEIARLREAFTDGFNVAHKLALEVCEATAESMRGSGMRVPPNKAGGRIHTSAEKEIGALACHAALRKMEMPK